MEKLGITRNILDKKNKLSEFISNNLDVRKYVPKYVRSMQKSMQKSMRKSMQKSMQKRMRKSMCTKDVTWMARVEKRFEN